jgi:TFIIF-interacting CTD phosphatase-like protein
MYMLYRPGLFKFLEDVSQHFEIILFNNGSKAFTDAVVKDIMSNSPDPEKTYFSHVLSKEHCAGNEVGHEIKNLEYFTGPEANRDIKDCVIIDNTIYCF